MSELIVALDVDSQSEAERIVDVLYPTVKTFKIGIHLFTACGPSIVAAVRKRKAEVFLDLKFFDIPNTVAQAVRAVVNLDVKMLTMHILGDEEMIKASVKACRKEADEHKITPPLLIGVTVLTSKEAKSSDVLTLAKIGIDSGLDGVVCSVQEALLLRQEIKKDFTIVTPGIRSKTGSHNDQKRIATVEEAVAAGSNYLVIGRPILEAKNPLQAAEQFAQEIASNA